MNLNYNNCLRPDFTKQIFEKILADKSLNPFGPKGIGKKRLLEDLEDLARQANIQTIRIDVKAHCLNYPSFLKQSELLMLNLSQNRNETQLLMSGKMDNPPKELPSVSLLIQNTKVNINQRLLILLENFDALIGTGNHNFPVDFFTDLNFLKGTPNIILCCTTEKSHKNSTLFFEGGKMQQTSFLDLEPIDVPPLKMAEIRNVLNKKMGNCENWKNEPNHEVYINTISETENPLVFTDLIVDDFSHQRFNIHESYKARIKKYKQQYVLRYKPKQHSSFLKRWYITIKEEVKSFFSSM